MGTYEVPCYRASDPRVRARPDNLGHEDGQTFET